MLTLINIYLIFFLKSLSTPFFCGHPVHDISTLEHLDLAKVYNTKYIQKTNMFLRQKVVIKLKSDNWNTRSYDSSNKGHYPINGDVISIYETEDRYNVPIDWIKKELHCAYYITEEIKTFVGTIKRTSISIYFPLNTHSKLRLNFFNSIRVDFMQGQITLNRLTVFSNII